MVKIQFSALLDADNSKDNTTTNYSFLDAVELMLTKLKSQGLSKESVYCIVIVNNQQRRA